jgi:ribosomal protein S18 acetylase RimI-like enzyme
MRSGQMDVSRSTVADLPGWRQLAFEVEEAFGAPMAESKEWLALLRRHIEGGTAWCVRLASDGPMVGGMWLSQGADALSIKWLAVSNEYRRRGVGRALVAVALAEAAGRPVHVVTFGDGHPMAEQAHAARELYRRLGFKPSSETPPDGPDGTPRMSLWHPNCA